MMFKDLIGKTMEVYMVDMLVKSRIARDHGASRIDVRNIEKVPNEAQPPEVCLWVGSEKVLGFMVN